MSTRAPTAAGTFYPGDPEGLSSAIEGYLDMAPEPGRPGLFGMIVPHAGYVYSGVTAAHAFKYLLGRSVEKVLILAPSHFEAFHGLSVYSGDALETPLGTIGVSAIDRDRIGGLDSVTVSELGFRQEHSLEVQLPFLQCVLESGWEAIPIVMGYQERETIDLASSILSHYCSPEIPTVISSDLSHYHGYDQARTMDLRFCDLVKDGNLDDLWDAQERGEVEACGFGPVFAFLHMAQGRGDLSVDILDYRNSGDTAGPKEQVVGYCAAGAFGPDG